MGALLGVIESVACRMGHYYLCIVIAEDSVLASRMRDQDALQVTHMTMS